MPNAKDNAKLTGDTHLNDLDDGSDDDAPKAPYSRDGGKASRSGGQATDKETRGSSPSGTRGDPGERPN